MADPMEDASVQRVTTKQREVMVTFMQEHPALASGRFKTIDGAKHKQRLTKEFSDTLNAVADGATKVPEKWMKCWQDWKSDVKKKAGKIKRHANGTGGGPPCQVQLTQLEEDVIAIMGQIAVGGQEATDPLDAQLALLRANANPQPQPQPEPEPGTVVTDGHGLVMLQAMPVNTWLDAISSTSSSTTTPLPTLSPITSDFSEPNTVDSEEGQTKRKRMRSEGGTNLTRSQEAIVRNANSLDRAVQIKESRLQIEMKKLEHEMAMKERELALREKETEAALKSASAMEAMAMAVTAAMQTFQAYLTKQ